MLLIKTRIDVSKIPEIGLGLFADQFIPKGTVTWKYHPGFDLSYESKDLEDLPEHAKQILAHYSYFDSIVGKFVLPGDNLRFINHSEDRTRINIFSTPHADTALKDIEVGEELFCDYNNFDESYFNRVGIAKEALK